MKICSNADCPVPLLFFLFIRTRGKEFMQIMIVEDNDRIRAMYRTFFGNIASEIVEARSGLEAVNLYPDCDPDVVLMDIRMPDMDGIDATRAIMKLDRNAYILIVTEYDDPLYRKDARDAGAREYFLKNSLLDLRQHLKTVAQEKNGTA